MELIVSERPNISFHKSNSEQICSSLTQTAENMLLQGCRHLHPANGWDSSGYYHIPLICDTFSARDLSPTWQQASQDTHWGFHRLGHMRSHLQSRCAIKFRYGKQEIFTVTVSHLKLICGPKS